MDLVSQAYAVTEHQLAATLKQRWAHSQGVARQARTLASLVGEDAELLEAAAIAHDIGYASSLVQFGFHPLDGAVFLSTLDFPARLVNLVAHHSAAVVEARLRGLEDQMAGFVDEGGLIRDALWWCDLTTSPTGEVVTAQNRIADIKYRYGPGDVVTRFIEKASPVLLNAVERVQRRLAGVR